MFNSEEIGFYRMERDFRQPNSRLDDWGLMNSNEIKSNVARARVQW